MRMNILCLLLALSGCVVSRTDIVTVEAGRVATREVTLPAGGWTILGPHNTYDFLVTSRTTRIADGETLAVTASDRAEFEAVLEGVKSLPVSRLTARNIELGPDDAARLAAITTLHELELMGVTIADPASLAELEGRVEVTVMPAASGAAELKRLSASPAITGLYLGGTELEHWTEILLFTGLRRLSVTSVSSTSAKHLAKLAPLPALARLELWVYRSDSLPGLSDALARLPALQELALNSVGDWSLGALKLPGTLRKLATNGARYDKATIRLIAGLSELRELEVVWPRVEDGDDLETLAALSRLQRLRWSSGDGYDGSDFGWLKHCPDLEVVNLAFANVSSLTLKPLRSLARLKVVDLRYTEVDPDAVDRADFASRPIIIYDRPTGTEVATIFDFK